MEQETYRAAGARSAIVELPPPMTEITAAAAKAAK
jgi:hypothetical protein